LQTHKENQPDRQSKQSAPAPIWARYHHDPSDPSGR
jgi:hypothetical protein